MIMFLSCCSSCLFIGGYSILILKSGCVTHHSTKHKTSALPPPRHHHHHHHHHTRHAHLLTLLIIFSPSTTSDSPLFLYTPPTRELIYSYGPPPPSPTTSPIYSIFSERFSPILYPTCTHFTPATFSCSFLPPLTPCVLVCPSWHAPLRPSHAPLASLCQKDSQASRSQLLCSYLPFYVFIPSTGSLPCFLQWSTGLGKCRLYGTQRGCDDHHLYRRKLYG